ncbi:hypothetical protein JCM10213_008133 [Rhodosporidiobolus nylandii]
MHRSNPAPDLDNTPSSAREASAAAPTAVDGRARAEEDAVKAGEERAKDEGSPGAALEASAVAAPRVSFASLPPELVAAIVNEPTLSWKDVDSLRLVSRLFLPLANAVLRRTFLMAVVQLEDEPSFYMRKEDLEQLELFDKKPDAAKQVEHLDIWIGELQTDSFVEWWSEPIDLSGVAEGDWDALDLRVKSAVEPFKVALDRRSGFERIFRRLTGVTSLRLTLHGSSHLSMKAFSCVFVPSITTLDLAADTYYLPIGPSYQHITVLSAGIADLARSSHLITTLPRLRELIVLEPEEDPFREDYEEEEAFTWLTADSHATLRTLTSYSRSFSPPNLRDYSSLSSLALSRHVFEPDEDMLPPSLRSLTFTD